MIAIRRVGKLALLVGALCLLNLGSSPAEAQERPAGKKLKEGPFNEGLTPAPATLDRSTPRRAWASLLKACTSRQWGLAMHLLDLGGINAKDRPDEGLLAASSLCAVLVKTGKMEMPAQLHPKADQLDDTPEGPLGAQGPSNYVVVLAFQHKNLTGVNEVWLRRVHDTVAATAPTPEKKPEGKDEAKAAPPVKATGAYLWVITRFSVSRITFWYKTLVKGEKITLPRVADINKGLGAPPEGLKLHSPRDSAKSFAKLCTDSDFDNAARLMDLSAIKADKQGKQGRRLARRLAMVLKRIRPQGFDDLSNEDMGSRESGVRGDREVVARTIIEKKELQVRLGQYQHKGDRAVWLFTQGTVASIDLLYKELGYGWAGDYLPALFFEKQLWEIQMWQWIGILMALIIAVIFGYFLSYVSRKLLLRVAKYTKWEWDDEVVACMRGPLAMVYVVVVFVALMPFLALAEGPRKFLMTSGKLLVIMAVGWFLIRLVDVAGEVILRWFKGREDDMGIAMVPVARKVLKTFIVAVILIMGLQNMGVNVAGLLATLGIGGLAMAMAAKSTLENLLAGITIAFDRPFKMGDYIQVGSIAGTVEDLGLRSTRLRTAERTVVTIPNSKIVDDKVENFAVRDKLRILTTFGVQYDTTLEQVLYIIDEFKRYLVAQPAVLDGFRVRFVGYNASSMDIEVLAYIDSTDFTEFSGIREQIYMELGKIVSASGSEMAFPSQTLYLGKDSHADPDKATKAAATVAERKEAGELWIPDIPDQVMDDRQGLTKEEED